MAGFQRQRRRAKPGPSKNELKTSHEKANARLIEQSARLSQQYPNVTGLEITWEMKTPTGVSLAQGTKRVKPDDPLLFDVPCEGGCGNGLFLLTDAVQDFLARGAEKHQGQGICRAASYLNPSLPCGTELTYRLKVV